MMSKRQEITDNDRHELEILTQAYLNQNRNLTIDFFNHSANRNGYSVAAEYCYLKNGDDCLEKYDEILKLARNIFDNKRIEFSNFVVNIDEQKCGKEKYSTIEGFVYNYSCDSETMIYEIKDAYYKNYKYVVEFYASSARQKPVENLKKCDEYKKSLGYKLELIDFKQNVFYDKTVTRCCSDECILEGINSLKDEILDQIKEDEKVYKMTFEKKDDHFVYSKIYEV